MIPQSSQLLQICPRFDNIQTFPAVSKCNNGIRFDICFRITTQPFPRFVLPHAPVLRPWLLQSPCSHGATGPGAFPLHKARRSRSEGARGPRGRFEGPFRNGPSSPQGRGSPLFPLTYRWSTSPAAVANGSSSRCHRSWARVASRRPGAG